MLLWLMNLGFAAGTEAEAGVEIPVKIEGTAIIARKKSGQSTVSRKRSGSFIVSRKKTGNIQLPGVSQ